MNRNAFSDFHKILCLCITSLIALCSTGDARGQLPDVAVFWDGGSDICGGHPSCGSATLVQGTTDLWNVYIEITNSSSTFSIRTRRNGVDRINSIRIRSANAGGTTTVNIGQVANAFRSVGSIDFSSQSDAELGYTTIGTMYLTEDIHGPIVAHAIGVGTSSEVGGSLLGDVILIPHSSTRSTAQMVVSGSILGNILVSNSATGVLSEVGQIVAENGSIGTISNPITIVAGRNIDLLRAGEINAFIYGWGTSGAASFVQWIERIETYTTGSHSGAFNGLIDVQAIANKAGQRNYLDFAGPMKGLIRIGYGHALNPSFPVNYIRVPQGGLEGQVIINALVAQSEWSRPVYVGAVDVLGDDLSPKPGYWETSSEIGGGAVGAVPYETHFTDCFPVFSTDDEEYPTLNYSDFHDAGQPLPIRIRHYGPVILPSGNRAFKVSRRLAGSTDAWIDETLCFTESLDPQNANIVELLPQRPLQAGFEYQVEQELVSSSPRLTCDWVEASSPPSVAPFSREFRFTICGPSLGDADSSGCVNYGDTTNVLANFGDLPSDCNKDGDANRDGSVNFTDVTTVLLHFGTSYCEGSCGEGEGFGLQGGMSLTDALTSLGYESVTEFISDIQAMSHEAMGEALQELGNLLQSGQ